MNQDIDKLSVLYASGAYILWGFLPIYWKLVEEVPAWEILAHRIIWSFLFVIIIILFLRKQTAFIKEVKWIIKDWKKMIGITLASIVISINWVTYIWAVNNEHVLQASLGYYINPLVSILLGMIVLKEGMNRTQLISFLLAGVGVLYLTISYGVFPWVSLLLAFSFATYGLLKKMVPVGSIFGLAIETMIVTPIALTYLFFLPINAFDLGSIASQTNLLLIGAGAATAIPLLLFASGAKGIPLAMVGFLQYIAPTIMLLLGIFAYGETFSHAHMISFGLIWIALVIYLTTVYRRPAKVQKQYNH
ncbi:EamA family transporter RarD [Ornithinibacillus halophilus]|uniref:Chloramphenicol-sensitive protein RarD n=1 Tax=Ornithinibacillus halophilus TaxID=930117 RepID=A0A1M5JGQ9_9BACI|nr:EamA family transporter RarD [Ornithinibacillus halophilus]SHG39585.1 chloramphenicol-sensitive protein RarD [Ornithinibacillus halophilus]